MPGHMFGKLDFGHFHLRRCPHLQFTFEIVVCFWAMFWDIVGGLVACYMYSYVIKMESFGTRVETNAALQFEGLIVWIWECSTKCQPKSSGVVSIRDVDT